MARSIRPATIAKPGLAVAVAAAFAAVSGGSDIGFLMVLIVGVGVFSVIVASVVSPRSAVIRQCLVAMVGAPGLRMPSDRNRMLRILINLVVNALRYAEREGSVQVTWSEEPHGLTIAVENAADAAIEAQLGACLQRGGAVGDSSRGLGIGLPLVGRIAAGVGAQLSTAAGGGVVAVAVTAPRA